MESTDNGYYKLSWGERIGFNSGELARHADSSRSLRHRHFRYWQIRTLR